MQMLNSSFNNILFIFCRSESGLLIEQEIYHKYPINIISKSRSVIRDTIPTVQDSKLNIPINQPLIMEVNSEEL